MWCAQRSHAGLFVAAAAGKISNVKDALAAEAEACVAAAQGAAELGLHRVILESDCKNLINALQSKSHDLALIGVCISSFESFSFQFAPRSCNEVAHLLAQHGLHVDSACEGWEDVAPESAVHLG